MKKAELILANFDARIPNIEIKPQNTDSKVVFSSKMYDEDDEHDMLNCFNRLQRVVKIPIFLSFYENEKRKTDRHWVSNQINTAFSHFVSC